MDWACSTYEIFFSSENQMEREHLGDLGVDRSIILYTMYFSEILYENSLYSGQDPVVGCCERYNEYSCPMKDGEFDQNT